MPTTRPLALALLALAALGGVANAQQVYRIVGPDGRVTFSDRPPADASKAKPAATLSPRGGSDSGASLPFELRTVASRYPVTLYTRPGCEPCNAGRGYLTQRGIPFSERTVTSQDDIDALQRIAGTPVAPFLTIGGQQLRGFSETEWGQFLDAAGYPRTSQLPASYRHPPAAPLVAVQAAPARPVRPAPAEQPAAETTPVAPAPSADNPAGIRF